MKKRLLQLLESSGPMRVDQLLQAANVPNELFQRVLAGLLFDRFVNVWPSAVGECIEVTARGRTVAHWPDTHRCWGNQ
jgi:hypothetical protein